MDVFIASSREQEALMRRVAIWIERQRHRPLRWDAPDMFLPGSNTLNRLAELSKTVDAAVFIFSEDDLTWYRSDSPIKSPRDNVIMEFGLFCGTLGFRGTAIVRNKKPKMPTDLDGLVYLNYVPEIENEAEERFIHWMKNVGKQDVDIAHAKLIAEKSAQDKKIEILQGRLKFAETSSSQLKEILEKEEKYRAGEWSRLFSYDFFWGAVSSIADEYRTPAEWRKCMEDSGLEKLSSMIFWDRFDDPTRVRWFIAKSLNTIRVYDRGELFALLMSRLPESVADKVRHSETNVAGEESDMHDPS